MLLKSEIMLSRYTMAGVVKTHITVRSSRKPCPHESRTTGEYPLHER
jgi:hypothetical protein